MNKVEKLILKVCDKEGNVVGNNAGNENAQDIELMFNPEELSFTRNVKWEPAKASEGSTLLPKVNFSGVEPYKLILKQLLFDTYESRISVMEKIDNIKKGVEMCEKSKEKRPPVYLLTWGDDEKNKYFHCVITSLTYKLNMFLSDGTPVRALVDITLQEVEKSRLPGTKESKSKKSHRSNPKNPSPPKTSPVR